MDSRITKLAKLAVNYSTRIQKGEKLLIDYLGADAEDLVKELIKETYAVGAYPFVTGSSAAVKRELVMGCTQEQLEVQCGYQLNQMKEMDAYIVIAAYDNASELSDVPSDKMVLWNRMLDPVLRYRVDHTKWLVLRYPTGAMAQSASMSSEAFKDFYFDVCTLDYGKMDKAMDPLVELMNKTDQVHILGPGTDLKFSIKDMPAIKCSGTFNIPDGEVFTAPVRDSMNGVISYNTPSLEMGFTYENIQFEVKDGKIVNATANNNEKINSLLDTDEGARYFGEFAIGVNPYIENPMKETLFDEKIDGSFHLTPGACYEECPNGNKSALHWDLVMIQRPEWGGGEIWFDGVLVRKDGRFVLPELYCLNPENLK
jgi:aminopeptidase